MNKPHSPSSDSSVFRQKAEELLKIRKQKTVLPNSETDIQKLIYELEVRQIELELQNEELARTKSYGDDLNKSLFQDNHSVILYIDAETGDIKKANPAACQYYGWSDAELCKKNISEINTLSQAEVVVEMKKAKEEKRNHFFFKHRLASGEIRDVEVYSGPVHVSNSILLYSFIHDITERKRTEEILSASELKYRNIFESVQDVYYVAKTDGTILELSPSIEQISKGQYKREDLIGKSILGIYANPDDRNIYISKLFKQGSITDYELSFLNKDGSIIPVSISSRLFFDADGNPATISGSMRDITERKQTELVLKQSNQKWEAIIAASPDGIGIVTLEGKLQLASDKLATMYGYTIPEKELFIGKTVFDFIDSSDHEKLIGNIRNLLNKEFNQTFSEYLAVRKDGSRFYTELNSSVLFDNKGNPESIMYVQRDISSRKIAEESIRESEEKYRNIFVNAQEGIFQTNVDGTYRSVNPALAKMYGFESPEELMNSRLNISTDSYLDPGEREIFLRLMEDQGYVKGYEYEVKRRDGSTIWLFEDAKTIKDKSGSIQYFEGFVVDITDRKLAENALNDKKNLLTNLIINLQEGILLEDANRKIVLTNQLFCDMFGIPAPPEVMVGADCSGSAEDSKFFFKNPVKFIADINIVLEEQKAVYNDELELADGRYFERDYIPTYLDNQYSGHLWKYRDISNRRKAEEGFKKISQAVEQSPIVNYITDLKGTIEYVNPKLLELTGYSREELIGKNPRIFSSGEKSSEDYANIYQTISSGLEWKGEFHNRRKNGELFWVSALISPVTDSKGKITHYLAVEEDITERKAKDKEIQKLSHALEQSPVIIIMTDLNGNFEYVNPAFHAITGYRPDEIAGKSIRILNSGETYDEVYQEMWETISAGNDWYGEWMNKKKSGEFFWVNVSVTPFRDDHGNITNYLAVEQDISARKLAEKEIQDLNANLELKIAERTFELAQTNENLLTEIDERKRVTEALSDSESNYRSVIENVNEVIFRTDAEGLWLFLNKSWTEITGFSVAESLGQLFVNYVHPDDRARNWELFEPLIKREKEYCRHQIRYLTKDGGFRWVEVFARLGINEQNEITGTFGTLQDITERREAETALAIEKQRLASIIEGTHVGTWEWNIQTGETIYNERWADILGYTLDELAPVSIETWMKLAHPDDFKISGELINKHFSGESDYYSFESRMKHKNGHWTWVLDRGKVNAWDENGKPLLMSGTHQDISEQKQAIDEIEESRERHRGLSEAAFDSIFFSEKGICIEQNSMAEKVFGYTTEEALGHYGTDWIVPEDRKIVMDNMMAGNEEPYEVNALRKDGTTFPCLLSGKMMYYKGRNVRVTSLHDITERKLAEEALTQMSSRLSLALRASGIGVWDFDLVNNVLIWDNQMFGIYGIREEDFSSAYDSWINGLHPDDKIRGEEEIQMAIRGEKEFDTEFRVVGPDGYIRFVKALAIVERDNSGKALRMIGTNWDITLQKQAADFENELLQLSPKLTGISFSEINSAIDMAIGRIGKFLSADRAYIFEFNAEAITMSNTHEWCNLGIEPEIENLQEIPCDLFPNWIEVLNRNENIIIPSVKDLPESWKAEREILEPQGIQSLIVIPLLSDGTLIGFAGLDSVAKKKEYNTGEINILKVWSSMLASLIKDRKSESLLEQTRQNYETFFNTIDDFLFVLDEQGNMIHTNHTVINRLEYAPEELLSNSVLMVHPAERREEAGRIVGEMLQGITEYCPVPLVTKAGRLISVETRVKPGFWDGKPVIFGVSKDVSQIKLSEEKFSKAFQSNSAMMAISSVNTGKFIEINDSYVKTLGYSREEMIGQTSADMNIYLDLETRTDIMEKLSQSIPVREMEIKVKTKSGNILTGLFSADYIVIGNEHCTLELMVDITDRKRAEEDIKKARLEAEQANMAKSEFLSRMSHELRTPMNSILGFAQLLEMGELNLRQKKGVTHILKSGKHLLDLINEVLDISSIEAGRISLSIEPVQLGIIIPEMLDIVRPQAEQRHCSLQSRSTVTGQLFVKSDRQRLKQVLLNLLNNAIKYNKEGGSVLIQTELRPEIGSERSQIRISITDTGLGISQQDIPKLFMPFERIGAEKTRTEGTGLGLSVVKKLMQAMGGNLGVESTPGEGSTFWIELPQSESPLKGVEKIGELTGIESKSDHKTGTILCIEDNASNIELIEQILSYQHSGIRLIACTNGNEAVKLAKEYTPDLILLDLNLPDIHGSKVLKLLKAEIQTMNIPVVVISADAMPHQQKRFLEAGVQNYLTKPLDIKDFLHEVDLYIPGNKAQDIS